jgi:Arc/MetJ family transcription regulator
MARTIINVDDELLAIAQRELGTTTKTATVNAALRAVAADAAWRDELDLIAAGGVDDPEALEEQMWRRFGDDRIE